LLNIDKKFDLLSIIFLLTTPLILIGAYLGEVFLSYIYSLKQFYLIFSILFLFLVILILLSYFLIQTDKSKFFILLIFLFLILFFAILYRFSIGDLSYDYSILSRYISKYPYFYLQTTDFFQDYEKYTRVKAYIIGFTDLKKIEKTKISVYFYSDNISSIPSGTIFLFSTEKLKKYSNINFLESKMSISLSRIDAISKVKEGSLLAKIRVQIRKIIFNKLLKYYNRWNLGSIYAILTGSRQFVFQPLIEIFQNTGTSHLFALSGQHLSILLLIVGIFTSNSLILILFSFIYLAFAGWQVSFLRAFYSLILAIIIKKFNIKPAFENIIALLTLLVFVSEPQNILSISFLLSISAIAALLATSILFVWLTMQKEKNYIKKLILIPFIGSLDIFIFQFPLILAFFGKINLITPLINLIAIPLFSFAIYFAIPSLIFNPFYIFSNIASGFFDLLSIFLLYISKFKIFFIELKLNKSLGFFLLFFIYLIHFILIKIINIEKVKRDIKIS